MIGMTQVTPKREEQRGCQQTQRTAQQRRGKQSQWETPIHLRAYKFQE
jgi:hypothetical protein